MARLAVLIHGMWGTADVWRNWRPFLEAHGWQTIASSLRHHDAPPQTPPPALATTSLHDYVADLEASLQVLPEKPVVIGHSMGGLIALLLCAKGLAKAGVLLTPAPPASVVAIRPSNLLAFARIQARWAWWRKPHRATLAEALSHTFNTTDPAEGTARHASFVHDSGRALFEIALPWLDGTKAATVDPRRVTVPLLFVAAEKDKLTPPGVVRRAARQFAHVSDYVEYKGQGHWVPGQPGWDRVAGETVAWLDAKVG
ncbi:MAG: alpha/beta fold hydrolase [Reyranella sp.]|uniref:alpha/beta hydrolase n=1 Tax=Reyranella sp. TaxID=1929291 RepID=UPI002731ED11|nr:alpha/beta fold hydrolase [Reyranella sp.]MDP1964690.1 alpha/beta fold hydrolase [Reyranella sp.]MDP2375895.1 alpha/beta fold hydrolase [Reyranella sp.]